MDKIHSKDCVIRICRHCAVPMKLLKYYFETTNRTWIFYCGNCNIYTENREDMHKSKRDEEYKVFDIRYTHDQFSKREVDTILMNGLNLEE